jgi:putative ABC transport system permease protein
MTRSRLRASDVVDLGRLGLRVRRARTALTAAGIAIGIAAMVAVLGISASSRADLLADLDALGTDLLAVTPGQDLFGEDATLPPESPGMLGRIGPVERAAAVTAASASVYRTDRMPDSETNGLAVLAADVGLLDTLEGTVAAGRFLDDGMAELPTVVLGSVAAERLGIDDLVGQPVVWLDDGSGGGEWFAVIGILDSLPLAPDIDRSVLIGEPAAVELFDADLNPSMVYLRTTPDGIDDARSVVPRTADPQNPEEVTVSRPSDALAARAAADTAFTALLLGLGAVALLVGGVGIANVMVISVLERRSEIGVRRALGATRGHVRLQFLVESGLLAAMGGFGGVALGASVTAVYARTQDWPVSVPLSALAGGVLLALLIGVLAGLYPASRAARLDPVEAIHPLS